MSKVWTRGNTQIGENPVLVAIGSQSSVQSNPGLSTLNLITGNSNYVHPSNQIRLAMQTMLNDNACYKSSPTLGQGNTRIAVAEFLNCWNGTTLTSGDVMITPGCAQSFSLCLQALATPGQMILCPKPGYPFYTSVAHNFGIAVQYYRLDVKHNWCIDLNHLSKQIKKYHKRLIAIVINSPHNPTGSVINKEQLKAIGRLAKEARIPIISDEVYAYMNPVVTSITHADADVPVLLCGGVSKSFALPGWRIGWIAIHDKNRCLEALRKIFERLMTVSACCNTLVQMALPYLLKEPPQNFVYMFGHFTQCVARIAFGLLKDNIVLTPILPESGQYMLIQVNTHKLRDINDIQDFAKTLIEEQSVYTLPGTIFGLPNFLRLSLVIPEENMEEACHRMIQFCTKHMLLADLRQVTTNSQSMEEDLVQEFQGHYCDGESSPIVTKTAIPKHILDQQMQGVPAPHQQPLLWNTGDTTVGDQQPISCKTNARVSSKISQCSEATSGITDASEDSECSKHSTIMTKSTIARSSIRSQRSSCLEEQDRQSSQCSASTCTCSERFSACYSEGCCNRPSCVACTMTTCNSIPDVQACTFEEELITCTTHAPPTTPITKTPKKKMTDDTHKEQIHEEYQKESGIKESDPEESPKPPPKIRKSKQNEKTSSSFCKPKDKSENTKSNKKSVSVSKKKTRKKSTEVENDTELLENHSVKKSKYKDTVVKLKSSRSSKSPPKTSKLSRASEDVRSHEYAKESKKKRRSKNKSNSPVRSSSNSSKVSKEKFSDSPEKEDAKVPEQTKTKSNYFGDLFKRRFSKIRQNNTDKSHSPSPTKTKTKRTLAKDNQTTRNSNSASPVEVKHKKSEETDDSEESAEMEKPRGRPTERKSLKTFTKEPRYSTPETQTEKQICREPIEVTGDQLYVETLHVSSDSEHRSECQVDCGVFDQPSVCPLDSTKPVFTTVTPRKSSLKRRPTSSPYISPLSKLSIDPEVHFDTSAANMRFNDREKSSYPSWKRSGSFPTTQYLSKRDNSYANKTLKRNSTGTDYMHMTQPRGSSSGNVRYADYSNMGRRAKSLSPNPTAHKNSLHIRQITDKSGSTQTSIIASTPNEKRIKHVQNGSKSLSISSTKVHKPHRQNQSTRNYSNSSCKSLISINTTLKSPNRVSAAEDCNKPIKSSPKSSNENTSADADSTAFRNNELQPPDFVPTSPEYAVAQYTEMMSKLK